MPWRSEVAVPPVGCQVAGNYAVIWLFDAPVFLTNCVFNMEMCPPSRDSVEEVL